MKGKPTPSHDLGVIRERVRSGAFQLTMSALQTAAEVGFGLDEVASCVVALEPRDFYKSMASETLPGTWQDVYRPVYVGVPLYVKLQLTPARLVVVISFKEL
jgi:hypothetical protein